MKTGIYSMRDEVAQTFGTPVQDVNDETARRNFKFAMANNKDVRSFAPEDFALYKVGEFDDVTGALTPITPMLLERGVKSVS